MIAPTPAHAHAWAAMRFELRDGHAYVVETCATCGAVRSYRAFERFWDPSAPSRPGGTPAPRHG